MKNTLTTFLILATICVFLASCGSNDPDRLVVMTHDSFSISEEVLSLFEQENNVEVSFIASGDSGAALNKAILSKNAPLADMFFGVDNTFLSRALSAGIFSPYSSLLLDEIPDEFELDPDHAMLPVDYGDVCVNYDKAWFEKSGLKVPDSFDSLLKPEYYGLLVVENPATSSPGLAFLLATIAQYGDPGYLDFWHALRENGLAVVDGWNTAYYTNFSASSGNGPQPMVVSYASSPAAEVIYSDTPVDQAPTAAILAPGTCFRQIEFVGIFKTTKNRHLAEKFVDFMLGNRFQEDIALQMFMYPVNPSAELPGQFLQWAQAAEQPAFLESGLIDIRRDVWISAWTETVLR